MNNKHIPAKQTKQLSNKQPANPNPTKQSAIQTRSLKERATQLLAMTAYTARLTFGSLSLDDKIKEIQKLYAINDAFADREFEKFKDYCQKNGYTDTLLESVLRLKGADSLIEEIKQAPQADSFHEGVKLLQKAGLVFSAIELAEAGRIYCCIAKQLTDMSALENTLQYLRKAVIDSGLTPPPKKQTICLKCGFTAQGGKTCSHCDGEILFPIQDGLFDGKYKIEAQLGKGSMGAVYKARQVDLDKLVAIKALLPNPEFTPEKFKHEAQLLSKLDNQHLPKVTDYIVADGKCFMVMEFVDGQTLEDILQKNMNDKGKNSGRPQPLDDKTVAEYGLQLCEILEYLHSHNPPIIFRDIKPENVMLENGSQGGKSPVLKLVDFGIAKYQGIKKTGTAIGTPGYAAPEQHGGKADERSDIYSLGVVLHHLLTGYEPSQTPFSLPLARQLAPAASENMERIIKKATEIVPEKRFENAGHMKKCLEQHLSGKQVCLYENSTKDKGAVFIDLSNAQFSFPEKLEYTIDIRGAEYKVTATDLHGSGPNAVFGDVSIKELPKGHEVKLDSQLFSRETFPSFMIDVNNDLQSKYNKAIIPDDLKLLLKELYTDGRAVCAEYQKWQKDIQEKFKI